MSAAPIYESVDAAARLMAVDSDADSLENLSPIFGVAEAPDLSFKDAVKCAQVRLDFFNGAEQEQQYR